MKKRLAVIALIACSAFAAEPAPMTLTGAGSTFIYPMLSKWTREYRKTRPTLRISYEPVGSGRGISRVLAGNVDFGASDGPLSDTQIAHAERRILHIPVVLGAVVPAYNLPGVGREVRFTPSALAGIFLGKITRWNDPELARANPGLQLPARPITVVFRTDGSGTTYVWTDYLSRVDEAWKKQVGFGTTVRFPVGEGAQFNEGVRDVIKSTPYAIGYLQSSYAVEGHVQYGPVENASGRFVMADAASITAAAVAAVAAMPADFRISIVNAAGADAYPVSSFSWLLVPVSFGDPAKRAAMTEFLKWALTDGQKLAAPMNYAPVPEAVASRVIASLSQIH
jgi:phosphate transport system substrate-binding protein